MCDVHVRVKVRVCLYLSVYGFQCGNVFECLCLCPCEHVLVNVCVCCVCVCLCVRVFVVCVVVRFSA